ncbi:carboxymuconolactone decarboxylase family protein [Mycobacterium sp. 21AC1]|uniref:carboxymuconolactone decarboxylase family protein n=1 Tax=[Mycobacterium] appelbergii TaxID=2939269 RepID=UPI00293903FF|nr:carboxymuconolactone decarboxylase family protein [Mycobacterium sp. 21AC1]MDV3125792.1 carboxymuconolactone decarboxylase family protein [Mycobacterium sp. 21AC1]
MTETNTRHEDLLAGHVGGWTAELEDERSARPLFFERFAAMVAVPAERGALSPAERALIGVGVLGNVANTNWPRLDAHAQLALRVGASWDQVRDVLQLVSIMSIHAMTAGVPALVRVLEERGIAPVRELDERRRELKEDFMRRRGYWHQTWDDVLMMDPDMFEAYTAFSTAAADEGSLDTRLRELIYIAIDCVPTHLYVPGVEIHSRKALDAGATPEQILTAIEIAALLGADPYLEAVKGAQRLPQRTA